MFSSRERVIRGFKNKQGKFLQYEPANQLSLGDIFIWDGWHARVELQCSLKSLGIEFKKRQCQGRHDQHLSASKVKFFQCSSGNEYALKLARKGCYSMQTFNTKCYSIDRLDLAKNISDYLQSGRDKWDKKWILVTDVWKAESYTRLVSSSWRGEAKFDVSSILDNEIVNIANPKIGAQPSFESDLTDVILAEGPITPYVQGAKYRRSGNTFSLIDYASTWRDRLSDFCRTDT
ncbi:hypothetical protein U2G71_004266 [Vibrio vulnificus]|nr:hypothetical protein [Vibrio vulnificus]HDY7489329.1 hypothetical protein [Vibrio vulnificus]HDY8062718.1 hypothetical protein [Vibrio vulnificus]HDY8081758.1 hypothetical protein [Vibrio vulnificus]HDY8192732.1 hypothetical protein [Vibrio vulnificus]